MGHQKGRNTKENVLRNFGMARPEGYRKTQRLMKLAERFGLPVICFIDTAGAYPGIGAEERGQSEAIAANLELMASLRVPTISVVIGEGGSGGALAIGVTNRILLEHSVYSVISPRGCASILWKNAEAEQTAAEQLKMTALDLHNMGICDEIVPEAQGGAHRGLTETAQALSDVARSPSRRARQARRVGRCSRTGTGSSGRSVTSSRPPEMFEQLLVAAALLQSFALLAALRRRHGRGLPGAPGGGARRAPGGDRPRRSVGLGPRRAGPGGWPARGLPWALEKVSRRLPSSAA